MNAPVAHFPDYLFFPFPFSIFNSNKTPFPLYLSVIFFYLQYDGALVAPHMLQIAMGNSTQQLSHDQFVLLTSS